MSTRGLRPRFSGYAPWQPHRQRTGNARERILAAPRLIERVPE